MEEQDASQAAQVAQGTGGVVVDQVAAPDINQMALAGEDMPSLAEMAHEPSSGAWPDGWYAATVLEGYATNSGHEFVTEDNPSKDGNSRNLRICIKAKNKSGEERNYFTSLNYRKGDLTAQTMGAVKSALQTAKEQKWKNSEWPAEWKDIHRSVIAIQGLAQLQRALGFKLGKTGEGIIKVAPFFGQKLDARLKLNEETGYSDVMEFAKFEERKKLYK
jgi:hypothetical protein